MSVHFLIKIFCVLNGEKKVLKRRYFTFRPLLINYQTRVKLFGSLYLPVNTRKGRTLNPGTVTITSLVFSEDSWIKVKSLKEVVFERRSKNLPE